MRLILASFERLIKKVQEQKNKCFIERHIYSLKASTQLSFNAFKLSQDSIAAYHPTQRNQFFVSINKIFILGARLGTKL